MQRTKTQWRTCKGYFSTRPRKFDYAAKARALDMYLNNAGIRKSARFAGASPALILRWLRTAGRQLAEPPRRSSQAVEEAPPGIIEMDEIYTFVKNNGGGQSYGLLILGPKAVLLRTSSAMKA